MQTIMKNAMLILLIACCFSLAANPASSNYIMQQWTFTAGNDSGDKPESAGYILSGSAIGTITGEEAESSNYGVMPGYYLGPIIGDILPPENITIAIVGTDVVLSWDAVTGADSYSVYYSDDPHKEAELWDLKQSGITGTSWDETIPGEKLFYYVKAVNSSRIEHNQ